MAKISPSMTPKCLACDEAKSTICGGLNKDFNRILRGTKCLVIENESPP